MIAEGGVGGALLVGVLVGNVVEAYGAAQPIVMGGRTARFAVALLGGIGVSLAAATVLGGTVLSEVNETAVAFMQALAGGAILAVVLVSVVPHAFAEVSRWVAAASAAGFLLGYLLSLWIEAYGRAWEERDPAAAAALFTEDALYRSHPLREPHVGSEGVRAYWTRATSTQADVDVRFGDPLVVGDKVAVEWWATMQDEDAEETIPGCLLLRFAEDGRCEELREYWHAEPGRHEPPDGWGL